MYGIRCLELATPSFRIPCVVQTMSALRTTNCWRYCRFALQIQELPCNIFQSVHTSLLVACRYAWGGKNSLRSNIIPLASKHCSAAHCASQRYPLDKLLMLAAKSQTSLDFAHLRVTFRRWRGITFAMEYSANFSACNANIKQKPAPCEQQSLLAAAKRNGDLAAAIVFIVTLD